MHPPLLHSAQSHPSHAQCTIPSLSPAGLTSRPCTFISTWTGDATLAPLLGRLNATPSAANAAGANASRPVSRRQKGENNTGRELAVQALGCVMRSRQPVHAHAHAPVVSAVPANCCALLARLGLGDPLAKHCTLRLRCCIRGRLCCTAEAEKAIWTDLRSLSRREWRAPQACLKVDRTDDCIFTQGKLIHAPVLKPR